MTDFCRNCHIYESTGTDFCVKVCIVEKAIQTFSLGGGENDDITD